MRLADVANAFNNSVCLDGYTGDTLFNGQLALYDDNKRDSGISERRILSVSPDVVIPERRAIQLSGAHFIIGHGTPDEYRGEQIRVGYVLHEAPYLSHVRTIAQVCQAQSGVFAYAGRVWIKDDSFTSHNSVKTPEYQFFFSKSEDIKVNHLVTYDNDLCIVRSVSLSGSDVLAAMTEKLPENSVETGTISDGTYDPVQAEFSTTALPVTVVRLRWQSAFSYNNAAAPSFEPGDLQLGIARAEATPKAGDIVTLSDGKWQVQSVVSGGAAWLCRVIPIGS